MAGETRGAGAGSQDRGTDKRYYRIGEVSRITGVNLYRQRDIEMIQLIKKLLYEQRFKIAGARKKLRELGVGRVLETGGLAVETDHRARYRQIRDELQQIRAML